MAPGIQHLQAAQLIELPSSSTRGIPALRNRKWQNSILTCGTSTGGKSVVSPLKIKIEKGERVMDEKHSALEAELKEAFHTRAKIKPEIIWVNSGDLERSTYKGQVFEKLYNK